MASDGLDIVAAAIGQMAVFRGALAEDDTLELFARRLLAEGYHVEDIVTACGVLERALRKEGEPAFPALATMVRECERAASQRRTAAAVKALAAPSDRDEPTFRCWQCLDSGWITMRCSELRCERERDHAEHTYAVRCVCWLRAHTEALVAGAQKAIQSGQRPSRLAEDAQAVAEGAYRYQRMVTVQARPVAVQRVG